MKYAWYIVLHASRTWAAARTSCMYERILYAGTRFPWVAPAPTILDVRNIGVLHASHARMQGEAPRTCCMRYSTYFARLARFRDHFHTLYLVQYVQGLHAPHTYTGMRGSWYVFILVPATKESNVSSVAFPSIVAIALLIGSYFIDCRRLHAPFPNLVLYCCTWYTLNFNRFQHCTSVLGTNYLD